MDACVIFILRKCYEREDSSETSSWDNGGNVVSGFGLDHAG